MQVKRWRFSACVVLALLLCAGQIRGSSAVVLACLALFLLLVAYTCVQNFTLPILLFFLPWSPILRTSPKGYSFFTFALVLVCVISILKKRFRFKNYHIVAGVFLVFLTLLSKLIDGFGLTFDYIAFLMLIFIFPVVKEEWTLKKYSFYQLVSFFSFGVILAALCALFFAAYPNIAKFIRVDSYLTIIRRSGFYGDANFYTAQITAALSGCLFAILRENEKKRIAVLMTLVAFLVYCGFLSGSKSFVIVFACVLLFWFVSVARIRGRAGLKIFLFVSFSVFAIFIATSEMFSDLIDVLITRFSFSKDLDSFTTGRSTLWETYLQEILGDAKVFFLGKGFTNVKINGVASHNTIIQGFFQFGLIGVPVLVFWIFNYHKDSSGRKKKNRIDICKLMIVLTGVFMPWLAIDALFFDEFFLLQWYVFAALRQSE